MSDAPTTDVSPSDSHLHDASPSETSPRRSKRLSLQKKPDACDARKYIQIDKVIESQASIEEKSSNYETLSNKEMLGDKSDEIFLLPEKGEGGGDD